MNISQAFITLTRICLSGKESIICHALMRRWVAQYLARWGWSLGNNIPEHHGKCSLQTQSITIFVLAKNLRRVFQIPKRKKQADTIVDVWHQLIYFLELWLRSHDLGQLDHSENNYLTSHWGWRTGGNRQENLTKVTVWSVDYSRSWLRGEESDEYKIYDTTRFKLEGDRKSVV